MPDANDDGLGELLGERPAERAQEGGVEEDSDSGAEADSAPAEAAGGEGEGPQETGYLGNGRYGRKDGIVERLDIYVSEETAKALRVAAATRDDPNGTSVSEIVRSIIEDAGYS
jgi:hypothetical protein